MSFFQPKTSGTSIHGASHSGSNPFIGIQAKLNIGEANSAHEKEADSVADQVVNRKGLLGGKPFISPTHVFQPKQSRDVDQAKKGSESNQENHKVQTKAFESAIDSEPIQKNGENNTSASSNLEQNLKSSKGGGSPMEPETKDRMESGFGADFSNVRIHNDSNAVQMSKDLGAQAFANGNDLYFNEGKYNPSSKEGQHLLAHELTHTIQQGGKIQKKEIENSAASTSNDPEFNIEIGFNAFIPNTLNAPVYQNNKAWKREPNPFSGKLFSSDNRTYGQNGSSRIWQKGIMKFKGTELISRVSKKGIGASEQADPVYKIVGQTPIHYGSDTGGNPIKKIVGIKNKVRKRAADKGNITKIEQGGMKGFKFVGEASYPFSSVAPDIDFNIKALLKVFGKGNDFYVMASIVGFRDQFPAYEAYITVNGKKNYFYTYSVGKNDGPGLVNLNSSDLITKSKFLKL